MRSCRSFLIAPGLLIWTVAFGFAACGSPKGEAPNGDAGAGGEAEHGVQVGVGGDAGDSAGGVGGAAVDGVIGGAGGLADAGGAGGEGGEAGAGSRTACGPSVQDLPDDEFADTNCDGIDGDAARAVFVAPTGDDTARGTMVGPVRSINRALALAAESKFPVYVCNGTYPENVVIEHGAGIYGGYDCLRDWARVKDRAVVQTQTGLPLTIDSVSEPVTVDRLAFRAASAALTDLGASSQAGAINNSSRVTLSHVEFTAGNGAAGVDGKDGEEASADPPSRGGAGADTIVAGECNPGSIVPECSSNALGGSGTPGACQFDGGTYWLEGGKGGDGANLWLAQGQPRCLNELVGPNLSRGTSMLGELGATGRVRLPGKSWSKLWASNSSQPGKNGTSGVGASAGVGSLRGALYVATNDGGTGTWGEPGTPGVGGDGGYSAALGQFYCTYTFNVGSGGGQGGLGGCGGGPASPGSGGGGSIALAIANSNVALTWVSIVTSKGGDGGAGAAGGKGQPGGAPGLAGATGNTYRGMDGAPGGDGGLGGASGPGGGGPSVGILYLGIAPKVTEGTFDIGVPGNGGALAGGGAAPVGVTGETYQLPE